jgi:CHAT domain-containing protein/tetratricopeptide (TPR) repeat protein
MWTFKSQIMRFARLSIFTILLAVFFLTAASAQNKKLDKRLRKIDVAYNIGDYPKALKHLRKFKSGAIKLGVSNYMVDYYIREARLNLASGILSGFEESLNNSLTLSEKTFGPTSSSFASTLIDVAELHNEYGNFRASHDYLERSRTILDKSGQLDDAFKARLALVKAEALIGQGFYNEAVRILREVESYLVKRAVEKETFVENGQIKTKRVPENEYSRRFGEYGRMLALIATSYGKSGKLFSADSAFLAAHNFIRKSSRYLGETNTLLVRTHFAQSKILAENNNGMVPEKSEKYLHLDNILSDFKKNAKPTSSLAHDIYLAYLSELIEKEYHARYNNVKSEYQKILRKYFSKTSIVHANLDAVEFTAKLHRDKTRNLQENAFKMLNSKAIPKNYKTTERIIEFLTGVALNEKQYANAENYIKQTIDIRKELYGENSTEYNLQRIKLANFYLDYTNNIATAGQIFDEAYYKVVAKEIAPRHKDNLEILNHLAKYYEITDNYRKASEALDQARDLAQAKYDYTDYAFGIELDYLAQLYLKVGEYEKAEENITRALKILDEFRKEQDKIAYYIHAVETQAKLFGIKGLFDEAEDNLDRSSKLIRKEHVSIAGDLSSAEELSSLYILLGKFRAAEDLLDVYIPEYEKLFGNQSVRLVGPLVNQGRIYLARAEYSEAERTALRANAIAVSTYGEHSTKAAPTQKLLADIYYTLGDLDKAEANCLKALSSQEKQFGRQHIEVAKSLSHLALIKFYKGDNRANVEQLMLESRDIMEKKLSKDNPQYAEILKNVAVLYISEGKYDIAFNSLTVAEGIWRSKTGRKNNINAASIYTLTGDVYYQMKNYARSKEFYNRAKSLYKDYFSTKHPEYTKVLSKLSKVAYMQKDYKEAKSLIEESLTNYENFIKLYFPALSEGEKAKYWNTIKNDFEFYNTLAFGNIEDFNNLAGKVYDYQLLTKAMLLSSSIKIRERIMQSTDEALKNQYTSWVQKKELLTLALSMSPQQLTENGIEAENLQQEVERLEKELSEKSELFGQSFENKRLKYEDIRKSLKPNEVAMEMVRFRYFNHTFTDSVIYAALYLKPENPKPRVILLKDGKKMETRFFKFYRNAITGRIPDTHSYNVYWKAINDELGQVSTIYLSADGIYNQINLEAIPSPDGRYIIDNSNIVLVSNTKDIYLKKVKSSTTGKENTAFMFGNPTFYVASADGARNISSLPGTEKEITQLNYLLKQKGWNTTEFTSNSAAEEKIKEMNSPKIFHIATHGLYRPSTQLTLEKELEGNQALLSQNPLLRTGLLLRGAGDLLDKTNFNYNMESGILTAYEAMSLNLDKTDLVVLSACETGLGDLEVGEGVYGLQRAFLVAGAKCLIMSMFKVDDEATQKLMLKFYQKWLNTGNLRQSFVEAKKELRVEYPDPIYWGAFIMIGME